MKGPHSGSSLTRVLTTNPFQPLISSLQSPRQNSNGLACQSRDAPPHPINYIPSELLSEIFLQCVSFPPDLSVPIILSHVCRTWRTVALETPALWDTIILPMPSTGLGAQDVRLVETFLRRSGVRPLEVDLGLVTGIHPWTAPADRHLKLLDDVVRVLIPHAGRIKILENVTPFHLLCQLRLSRLNHLEELVVCKDERSTHIDYPVDGNQFSDTLRVLDLNGTVFDISRMQLPRALSELYVREPVGHGQVSVLQSIDLFSALPRLTHCSLDITRQSEVTIEHALGRSPQVVLLDLEVLYIGWSEDISVGPIIDALTTPKLSTLSLRGQFHATIPWAELNNFVKRNKPPLSVLSLIGSGIIDPSFMECLKERPLLENLTLTQFELDSAFFDALTFKPGEESERLLPKLDYLDFEWCTFPDFSRFVAMLKSRGSDLVDRNERLGYFRISTNALTNDELRQLHDCGIEYVGIQRY